MNILHSLRRIFDQQVLVSIQCFMLGLYGGENTEINFEKCAIDLKKNIKNAPGYLRSTFIVAFLFYDFFRPAFTLHFKFLRNSTDQERCSLIARWYRHPLLLEKLILTGLKYICVTEIFSQDSFQKKIGYFSDMERRKQGLC